MADILTDGIWTAATEMGPARLSAPIPSIKDDYVLEQDYIQDFASFVPLALDTAHPTAGTYRLIGETPLIDVGCGAARWTRIYAQVPSDHDEYESFAYNFIGWAGVWASIVSGGANAITLNSGRPRRVQTVVSRVAHHYVLTTTPRASNPPILAQRYTQAAIAGGFDIDFIYNTSGPWTGFTATVPTRAQYEAVMAGGSGLGTGAAAGEIVAEDSRLIRWLGRGNIWLRQTRYVYAL